MSNPTVRANKSATFQTGDLTFRSALHVTLAATLSDGLVHLTDVMSLNGATGSSRTRSGGCLTRTRSQDSIEGISLRPPRGTILTV
jgi:hypothetical protein